MVKIHYYALCWNEEKILPLTLDYYSKICSKIVIYDNESTDNSAAIIRSYGGIVETYRSNNEIRNDIYIEIKNNCWKQSRGEADWVIVGDIDELLYCPDLPNKLYEIGNLGYSIVRPFGFDMVTENFPKNLMDVKYGMPDNRHLSKCICFNPNKLEEMNFKPGAHKCKPKGKIKIYNKDDIMLLHYKYLGLDYLLLKMNTYRERSSQINKDNKWGKHYENDNNGFEQQYLKRWNNAVKVPK